MAISPSSRETALALPNVYSTSPRRTNSRLASRTSARSASSTLASPYLRRNAPQLRQNLSQFNRRRSPRAEAEIELPVDGIQLLIYRSFVRLRFHRRVPGAQRTLRFLDRLKRSRRQEREDCGPQTRHIAVRHQNRLAHHVGVYLIEYRVLLRNTTAVDDPLHRNAVLFHAFQNHPRMKGRAFDGGEVFVLRR